jgi:hypothetical protein
MRTDGVNMAEEAYVAARSMIQSNYGARYLPENTRRYSSKAKNAQEAHEAVRPTDFHLRPEDYHGDGDLKKLYTLIWRRAVASQMEAALFERTTIDLAGGEIPAGGQITRTITYYAGPKKLSELQETKPPMGDAIDFGFFSAICVPMLWLMRFFHGFTGNWGVAIILLTILVKLITLPLTFKQYKSMAGMKKVQPLMKALQEKLAALGHDVGKIDGILGAGTRTAVQKEQVRLGLPADGWPTKDLLDAL